MSLFKKAAIKFLAETLVGNFLSEVGQHVGDAVGTVLGRKIDPDHAKIPKVPDHHDEDAKK